MTDWNYRLTQPWLLLGMVLINIIYALLLLILWPWIFIGSLVWKFDRVLEYTGKYFNWILNIEQK